MRIANAGNNVYWRDCTIGADFPLFAGAGCLYATPPSQNPHTRSGQPYKDSLKLITPTGTRMSSPLFRSSLYDSHHGKVRWRSHGRAGWSGWAVLVLWLCLVAPAFGQEGGEDFAACLARIEERAIDQGISASVVRDSLDQAEFVTRVVELDRQQPEFVTPFTEYYTRRVTESRVEQGRELLAEHEALLQRIYREYGVPPRYLVAFWGLETNYGSYFGRMSVIDSLATLACDVRRSEFFTEQLLAALRILDDEDMTPARMEGSWAGAMGHVQFMPTAFQEYAVDYDGDGRRDLWNSLPDAFASAANFLRARGWQTDYRWGREVQLPKSFPYELAGRKQQRPLDEWRALGVRTAFGQEIDGADIEAAVILPAGRRGPAFLVYDNFDVIMRWNPSTFYALSVGRLADRIAGGSELQQPLPEDVPALQRADVMELQAALRSRGFLDAEPDGIIGPNTRDAIRNFQLTQGMVADGHYSAEVLDALGVEPSESG